GEAREVLIGIDDAVRRLAYSVVESPLGFTHSGASNQVFAVDGCHARFVWITDLLPDELATRTAELMEYGIRVIKQTMESQTTRRWSREPRAPSGHCCVAGRAC